MIRLEVSAPDAPLTANQRLHYHEKAARVRNWRLRTAILARKVKPVPHAHVICYLHFQDNRRRDAGNWYPTAKACLDGIVDAGVLEDDSDNYVIGPDMRRGEKSPAGFAITLTLDPDCECVDCDERFGGSDVKMPGNQARRLT